MTAEVGHFPSRQYEDQAGNVHLNGANLLDVAEVPFPQQVAISNAAGGTQYYCEVTFQLQDGAGNDLAVCTMIDWWLSDASTGIGLTATSASSTVGAGASGTDLGALTSKKAGRSFTDVTGKYILQIIDSAKTGFYPCCSVPGTGKIAVGAQLTSASYHS
jgi:hypothetical protein